ncbi:outer membrane efflux protein [Anaerobacterium chartisolvens]|uniref:Outer membrane efflux protein n=1 Tax=Anaerobacterium chartisolvens TaxID=1297424 RepID=A0A369AF78_9FIRM|nr:TolC family protein [Anaerobacterium chartisolvens]RCX07803.1 outer membrane efflux protein [Anaerobacterium chartisolvens]
MKKLTVFLAALLTVTGLNSIPVHIDAAQTDILSVEQTQDKALIQAQLDEKLRWYEEDWEDTLDDAGRTQDQLDDASEADDDIRRFRNYLATDDYKNMRLEIDDPDNIETALGFLYLEGYVNPIEYIVLSETHDTYKILTYFNDDKVVKRYYEYILAFYPQNIASPEDKIDLIENTQNLIQKTEAGIKQQRTALEGEKDQLRVDVYKAYTDYITALKSMDNASKNLQAAQKTYENYEKKYSLGVVSKTELMDAQLQRDTAEIDSQGAQRNAQSAEFALKSLIGMDMSQILNIDRDFEPVEIDKISSVKLIENMEKDNINLFIYNETVVKPAVARFDIAQTQTSKKSDLYKDLEDEKNKAELEFAQMKDKLKTAIISQVRGIKTTQRAIEDNVRKLEIMERQKELLKLQVDQGLATDLDLMKLENGYNTLNTAIENMKYVKAYQWYMLQHTILY